MFGISSFGSMIGPKKIRSDLGYDLNNFSSVQVTKSVATEVSAPSGIAFNDDGSKIFMVGFSGSSFNEYNLTTSFDLSTKSAVQASQSLASEDPVPSGMAFNNDGSKIFMVGFVTNAIYEYNLTTPFDLSTKSAVQVSTSVATEDTAPQGIAFNSDGSKIFVVGGFNEEIYEYNLTTSFDLSTKSAVQASASVTTEDTAPQGMAFNNDGSKIFMVGSSNDSIYEYRLAVPFNLLTISAVQVIRSVTTEDTTPTGIAFNNDGSKMFMVGSDSDSIHEYNL